jgi:hypothetical protein
MYSFTGKIFTSAHKDVSINYLNKHTKGTIQHGGTQKLIPGRSPGGI